MKITLHNITKKYVKKRNTLTVINSFSYEFEENKMYLIKGYSGSGKTTLLSLIGLLDKPSDGEIIFDNKRVDNLNSKEQTDIRRNNISFIFQEYGLLENLSVYENIRLVLEESKSTGNIDETIDELLVKLQLKEKKYQTVKELSGGEKQRTSVARALIKKPDILICDEPISNLDSKNAKMIISILDEIKNSCTVIVSCHTEHFDDVCDAKILMDNDL